MNQADGEPLPNTLDINGNDLTVTAFTGSRYVTYYDSAAGKIIMKVAVEFEGEQNSDWPDTILTIFRILLGGLFWPTTIPVPWSFLLRTEEAFAGCGGDENIYEPTPTCAPSLAIECWSGSCGAGQHRWRPRSVGSFSDLMLA